MTAINCCTMYSNVLHYELSYSIHSSLLHTSTNPVWIIHVLTMTFSLQKGTKGQVPYNWLSVRDAMENIICYALLLIVLHFEIYYLLHNFYAQLSTQTLSLHSGKHSLSKKREKLIKVMLPIKGLHLHHKTLQHLLHVTLVFLLHRVCSHCSHVAQHQCCNINVHLYGCSHITSVL